MDFPTAGQRERDLRNGFTMPPEIRFGNIIDVLHRPGWLWHFLTSLRMLLENVRGHATAAKNLFSIIDYTASQFDPSVTWEDADWMIREWNGPFAIKALSLGAKAVMAGRAYLYGLGAGGEAGVDRALQLLITDIKRRLRLVGCTSVQQLDGKYVREIR